MTDTDQDTSIVSVLVRNASSYNVTEEHNTIGVLDYIDMVIIPMCLITGVFGNLVTIILMHSPRFSSMASKYFLVALALSDISVLFTQPFKTMFVIRFVGQDVRSLSEIGCKFYYWLHKTGKMTSSWLIVFISLERLTAIKFPFRVKRWFSKKNSLIIILVLYLFIGGFNIGYSYCTKIDDNGLCNPDVYDLNDTGSLTLYRIMANVGVTLYFLGPLSILFIITPIIIVSVFQSNQKHSKLTHSHLKMADIVRPTTMLLTVIVAYIVFATPIGIVRIISSTIGVNLYDFQTASFLTFRDIAVTLELVNYAANFFLYVCSSKRFRDGFRMLLCSVKYSSSCDSKET